MSSLDVGRTARACSAEVASRSAAAFRSNRRSAARCVFRTTLTVISSTDAVLSSVSPPSTRWRNTCCCRAVSAFHAERGNCRNSPRGLRARAQHHACHSRSERASPASARRPPRHASQRPQSMPPLRCPVAPFAEPRRRPQPPEAAPRRPNRRARRPSTWKPGAPAAGDSARDARCTATRRLDPRPTGPEVHASASEHGPAASRRPRARLLPMPTSIAAPWGASVHAGSVPEPAGCHRRRHRHTATVFFTWHSFVPPQTAGPRGQPPRRSPRQTVKRP